MLPSSNARLSSDWELKNELNKTNVRWALVIAIAVYIFSDIGNLSSIEAWHVGVKGTFNLSYILILTATSMSANFLFLLFLLYKKKKEQPIHPSLKYLSMIGDCIIITLLLPPTGGDKSIFFLLYIVVILSNGVRYGMRLAISAILVFNISYVGMLFYQYYPVLAINDIRTESLKVIGIWIVGLYIGYLARRFEILHADLERYKLLLKEKLTKEENNG